MPSELQERIRKAARIIANTELTNASFDERVAHYVELLSRQFGDLLTPGEVRPMVEALQAIDEWDQMEAGKGRDGLPAMLLGRIKGSLVTDAARRAMKGGE